MELQESQARVRFPFFNTLRVVSTKGGQISTKLLDLLKGFEEALARRLRKLSPKHKEEVVSFEWMAAAIESVCATHNDIKTFIADLELPIAAWDDKWIQVYMDMSLKLLDLCVAYSSEISRIKQGNIYLQCAVYNMNKDLPNQFIRARSSFYSWRQTLCGKNHKMENCSSLLNSLKESLDLPKVKNSAKGKVLMSALHGMKVQALLVCSVFASVFSGTAMDIMDVDVSYSSPWTQAYSELQANVNEGVKEVLTRRQVGILEEVNAVDSAVKKLYPIIENAIEPTKDEEYKIGLGELTNKVERLSHVLDVLGKDVDGFFKIVLSSRDALLCGLRGSSYAMTDGALGTSSKQLTVR